MIKLKLIKGLSYSGIVSATAKSPYVSVEDEAAANMAVASGYFAIVAEEDAGEAEAGETEPMQYGGKLLDDMNKSELETFAAYKGISLKGITKKADIIAKLKAELPEEETEGAIYYGSPTMTELQEAE